MGGPPRQGNDADVPGNCAHCGRPIAPLDAGGWTATSSGYLHNACVDAWGRDAGRTTASVPFMITNAMKANLRKRGVHPDVIRELRPEDAHLLLDACTPMPPSAARSPEHDLRALAVALAGQDSSRLAHVAMHFVAKGIVITPTTIDTIKAGGEAPFAVRDAIWVALS